MCTTDREFIQPTEQMFTTDRAYNRQSSKCLKRTEQVMYTTDRVVPAVVCTTLEPSE